MSTPTRSTRSTQGAAKRNPLVVFFVEHPIAKILSFVLALIVVWMVHQQLQDERRYDHVRVNPSAPTGSSELKVSAPEGYEIVEDRDKHGETQREINVRVLGLTRDLANLERRITFRAAIPRSRVENIKPFEKGMVKVEPLDVTIDGFPELTVSFEPFDVGVSEIQTLSLALAKASVKNKPDGYDETVIFDPEKVNVRGPGSVLDALFPKRGESKLLVDVVLPQNAPLSVTEEILAEVRRRPVDAGATILEQDIKARVRLQPTNSATLSVPLPILVLLRDVRDYEYKIELPHNPAAETITLHGSSLVIDTFKDDAKRRKLISELRLVAYVDEAVQLKSSSIGAEWTQLEATMKLDREALQRNGLTWEVSERLLAIKVRKIQ